MLDYFLGSLVSLLVICNPPSKIPLFISLTQHMPNELKRSQALWAAIYSFMIMLISLLAGNVLLSFFGISASALRIAGGGVVAIIGYRMLFEQQKSVPNQAPLVKRNQEDYAFFPIAMPMIAGPGTMAVIIGYSTQIVTETNWGIRISLFSLITLSIFVCSFVCWIVMRFSDYLSKKMGYSGITILSKCMGFLLICIGIQFIGSGIKEFYNF